MFCMCVPWELNLQPFALLTQCSTTEPQEHFLIMNRKQEGPCMGTRGRETQDMGTQVWHNPPPPNRHVPRHTTSNGEGGWALWRPQGTWSLDRWPIPGPTAEQGAWAAMVDPGTWAAMVDTGTTWAMAGSPPKKLLVRSQFGGALGKRRHLGPLWWALLRSGLWRRVLWRQGFLWALWRRGFLGALCRHIFLGAPWRCGLLGELLGCIN